MTDEEIIKSLECCIADTECFDCPYYPDDCVSAQNKDVLNFIKRHQAEIETLKIENQSLRGAANSFKLHYNEARTEAVKEFAERLKNKVEVDLSCGVDSAYYLDDVLFKDIDDLVKEMVGDTE